TPAGAVGDALAQELVLRLDTEIMIILFLGCTPRSAKSRPVMPSVRTMSRCKDSQGRYLRSPTYAGAAIGYRPEMRAETGQILGDGRNSALARSSARERAVYPNGLSGGATAAGLRARTRNVGSPCPVTRMVGS